MKLTSLFGIHSQNYSVKMKNFKNSVVECKKKGISVFAYKACADMYDVSPKLKKLGINMKFMGEQHTKYI